MTIMFNRWFSRRSKPSPMAAAAATAHPVDPEIARRLEIIEDRMGQPKASWAYAMAIGRELQDILEEQGLCEHDYVYCRQLWTILVDNLRDCAADHGAVAELDRARQISQREFDFAHYVINPILALPPSAVVDFILDGITVDGRRVFQLVQHCAPDVADEAVEARIAADTETER
jgi:hypothetical protein